VTELTRLREQLRTAERELARLQAKIADDALTIATLRDALATARARESAK
jgi:hypothetical protein